MKPEAASSPNEIGRRTSVDTAWLDEIDLDPTGAHPAMATRSLGARPWLVNDDLAEAELAYKRRLLAERHGEVFAVERAIVGVDEAAAVVDALVAADRSALPLVADEGEDGVLHPLDRAGRRVQEDLCLMAATDRGWVLAGASLCFPSQWALADKLGRPMAAIHQPVAGYEAVLDRRVDSLFDALAAGPADRIVWRRNWFVRPDWELFQPRRSSTGPVSVDQFEPEELFLRSERQTLRPIPGLDGWILFTIRTQHARFDRFLADGGRALRFARFLAEGDPSLVRSRGLIGDALEPTAEAH